MRWHLTPDVPCSLVYPTRSGLCRGKTELSTPHNYSQSQLRVFSSTIASIFAETLLFGDSGLILYDELVAHATSLTFLQSLLLYSRPITIYRLAWTANNIESAHIESRDI